MGGDEPVDAGGGTGAGETDGGVADWGAVDWGGAGWTGSSRDAGGWVLIGAVAVGDWTLARAALMTPSSAGSDIARRVGSDFDCITA